MKIKSGVRFWLTSTSYHRATTLLKSVFFPAPDYYSESGRMPPSSGGGVCQDNRIGRRTIQVGIGFRTFDKKEKRTDRKEKRTDRKEKRA